ncbi:MAG: hypothetical protein LKJ86_04855 [Oscillibacter sp.]|jgi:protein-S-isoprenylcysteine O-methyltransferase Ste14|nr:hypothetical protein [Oscillibacter sp.]
MKANTKHSSPKKKQANLHATFRGVVSLYLLYLAVQTVKGVYGGSTTMPVWIGWVMGVIFAGAAIGFGVYTWRQYRKETAGAEDSD